MLEMANLLGMNTAEYVRKCVVADLCAGQEIHIPEESRPELEQMIARNQERFLGSPLLGKPTETESDSILMVSG